MFTSIRIRGYRGLSEFTMRPLGRINLLVGENNSGKTSVLEGMQLLATPKNLSALELITGRRGEVIHSDSSRRLANLTHLFHGHDLQAGKDLSVLGETDDEQSEVFILQIAESEEDPTLFEAVDGAVPELLAEADWGSSDQKIRIPLDTHGGALLGRVPGRREPMAQFISTSGLTVSEVITMFERIVLTPNEDLVVEALRAVDPTIERIATVSEDHRSRWGGRGGIVVKREGVDSRVPIGSLGDGMWRMLGVAIGLVMSRGGILLIDEIDTGLHHSILSKMWQLVFRASDELDVQVFATTHSRDCVESIASIAHSESRDRSDVMIHRIESGLSTSIPYSEAEIVAAAEAGIEVR